MVIGIVGMNYQHYILLRTNGAVLSPFAYGTVASVAAVPEKEAVFPAIGNRNYGAVYLADPAFRQDLPAFPDTFLKIELTELGHIRGTNHHTAGTKGMSLRIRLPLGHFDSQRLKEAGHKVLC